MALELGERLVEVGLLTRARLREHTAGGVPHGAALARKLVDRGLVEEALAGFFLAEGFGPLAGAEELSAADDGLVRRLPGEMAWDFLVLPLRRTPSGVVVAMAVPSDRHLVREIGRVIGENVLPTVARLRALTEALTRFHPAAQPAPATRADSEPPVLHLTKRRAKPSSPTHAAVTEPTAPPRVSLEVVPDDDVPLPLVRHKPVASKTTVVAALPEAAPPAPEATAPAATAPAPEPAPPSPSPRTTEPAGARNAADGTGTAKMGKILQKTFPAPVSRAESVAAFQRGSASRSTERKVKTSEYEHGAGKRSEEAVSVGDAPAASPKTTRPGGTGAFPAAAPAEPVEALAGTSASDRWDLPAEPAASDAKLSGRVSLASLPSNKAAAGDITPTLTSMKSARDRDAIVRLACEGAITVGRSSVFLALRKGVLKGWDGAGQGVSRDSVRNLWIPAGSESMFKRVLDGGAPFVGAYGTGIADGLFRAAVGSRGGDVAVWPVTLEGKPVGLLCVDDLRPGSISRHRIETLTVAVSDGFRRLINTGKNE